MSELDEWLNSVDIEPKCVDISCAVDDDHAKCKKRVRQDLKALIQKREAEAIKKTFPALAQMWDSYHDEMFTLEQMPTATSFFNHDKVKTYLESQLKPTQVDDKGYEVESLLRRYSDKVKSDQEFNPSVKGDESELL